MPITWIEGEPSAAAAAIFNGTLINGGREGGRERERGRAKEGEIEFQTLQSPFQCRHITDCPKMEILTQKETLVRTEKSAVLRLC